MEGEYRRRPFPLLGIKSLREGVCGPKTLVVQKGGGGDPHCCRCAGVRAALARAPLIRRHHIRDPNHKLRRESKRPDRNGRGRPHSLLMRVARGRQRCLQSVPSAPIPPRGRDIAHEGSPGRLARDCIAKTHVYERGSSRARNRGPLLVRCSMGLAGGQHAWAQRRLLVARECRQARRSDRTHHRSRGFARMHWVCDCNDL